MNKYRWHKHFSTNGQEHNLLNIWDVNCYLHLDGPSSVSITASHPHNNLVVGNTIRLTCASDGNPTPNFTWNFNSTDIVNGKSYKLTDRNKTLEYRLKSLYDSGYYLCLASNSINGKKMEMNASVLLTVNEVKIFQLKTAKSCSEIACSFFEECFEKDGAAICSMNIWKVTAFLFIAVSLILVIITTHLCFSVRLRKMTFIPLKNKDKIRWVNEVLSWIRYLSNSLLWSYNEWSHLS